MYVIFVARKIELLYFGSNLIWTWETKKKRSIEENIQLEKNGTTFSVQLPHTRHDTELKTNEKLIQSELKNIQIIRWADLRIVIECRYFYRGERFICYFINK